MGAGALPADTHVRSVALRVADMRRALDFYVDLVGFRPLSQGDNTATLSATGAPPAHIGLTAVPDVRPKPANTTGLFHVAIRLPTRRALARLFRRLLAHRWPFHGASDHGVSEALYLADPDGNGLELYTDRPHERWPYDDDGQLAMTTQALDTKSLLRLTADDEIPWSGIDSGTDVGHVHLQVSDLEQAERFYAGILGLDVTQRSYPGARFFAAGGYHHHVGTNVWNSLGAPAAPSDTADLDRFVLCIPDEAAWRSVAQRASTAGVPTERLQDGVLRLRDPDGITIDVEYPGKRSAP